MNKEIFAFIQAFRIAELTFDQYSSTQSIQQLQARAQHELPWRPHIHELTATQAHNFNAAEIFKTAVNAGLVHAPHHELARAELLYLVEKTNKVSHPNTGPVRTDDVADAMINAVYLLLHDTTSELFKHLGSVGLHAHPGLGRGYPTTANPHAALSSFNRSRKPGGGTDPSRGRRRL